jgi:hypothetical protein
MVDYSKWEKFAAELSDDEEESTAPTVTRLDDNERVNISPKGVSLETMRAASVEDAGKVPPIGKDVICGEYNVNDGETGIFLWRQDKDHVYIRIDVDASVKASEVQITYSAKYTTLAVSMRGQRCIQGPLQYDIEIDADGLLDWELLTTDIKYISLTLIKKSPLPGTTLWWSRVFKGDLEIDVSTIQGRKQTSQSFAESWSEAHRMFREKVAERTRVNIDDDV